MPNKNQTEITEEDFYLTIAPNRIITHEETTALDDVNDIILLSGSIAQPSLTWEEIKFYISCWNGSLESVRHSVENKETKLNVAGLQGYVGIILACRNNHDETVRYLLYAGCDIKKDLQLQFRMILFSGMYQNWETDMIHFLEICGMHINEHTHVPGKAVHMYWTSLKARDDFPFNKIINHFREAALVDIQAITVKKFCCLQETPLQIAIGQANLDTIRVLLDNQANTDSRNWLGITALQMSIDTLIRACLDQDDDKSFRYFAIACTLINSGAHIDIPDRRDAYVDLIQYLDKYKDLSPLISELQDQVKIKYYPLSLHCQAARVVALHKLVPQYSGYQLPPHARSFVNLHRLDRSCNALAIPTIINANHQMALRLHCLLFQFCYRFNYGSFLGKVMAGIANASILSVLFILITYQSDFGAPEFWIQLNELFTFELIIFLPAFVVVLLFIFITKYFLRHKYHHCNSCTVVPTTR